MCSQFSTICSFPKQPTLTDPTTMVLSIAVVTPYPSVASEWQTFRQAEGPVKSTPAYNAQSLIPVDEKTSKLCGELKLYSGDVVVTMSSTVILSLLGKRAIEDSSSSTFRILVAVIETFPVGRPVTQESRSPPVTIVFVSPYSSTHLQIKCHFSHTSISIEDPDMFSYTPRPLKLITFHEGAGIVKLSNVY